MQTHLIAVGNSKGLRLPKHLLAQCGITDAVTLTVTTEGLLIAPAQNARSNWEERIAAEAAHTQGVSAAPLHALASLPNAFDDEEWTWTEQQ